MRRLFKRLTPQSQNYFKSTYRLTGLKLSFGSHISLVNTILQVFNNATLDVNVLTVAESSPDLAQNALYLSLHLKVVQFPSSTLTNVTNNVQLSATR